MTSWSLPKHSHNVDGIHVKGDVLHKTLDNLRQPILVTFPSCIDYLANIRPVEVLLEWLRVWALVQSWCCHFVAVWPWVIYFTSVGFQFLHMLSVATLKSVQGLNWDQGYCVLSTVLAHSKQAINSSGYYCHYLVHPGPVSFNTNI